MKLQYRYSTGSTSFKRTIRLYYDGWLGKAYEIWVTELDDEIDTLEALGYAYGYTEEEVSDALKRYENMRNNIISKEN